MKNPNHRRGRATTMNGASFISTAAVFLVGTVLVGGCGALSAVFERGILRPEDLPLIIEFLTSEDGPLAPQEDGPLAPQEFTLTVDVQGGGSVDPGSGTFEPGKEVRLIATPDEGWRFDRWEGDLTGRPYDHWRDPSLAPANPATLVIDADKEVMAIFIPKQTETETFDLGGGVTLTVINIPGGSFTMGSSDEEQQQAHLAAPNVDFTNEGPQHTVAVSSFAMGETEVTQAQFEALMGFVPTLPEDCGGGCFNDSYEDNRPVVFETWIEADAFCHALSTIAGRSCRLPTEAEWEFACRAGSDAKYTFGDLVVDLDDYAWFNLSVHTDHTHDVATKLPNTWGLFDVHGNAWEWVGDWNGEYPGEARIDPTGPGALPQCCDHKVLRGGSYQRRPQDLRSAMRMSWSPDAQIFNYGFRVVCE